MPSRRLRHARGTLPLGGRPLLMGVVNVTPDSFSDGGLHHAAEDAIAGARRLAAEGADILDIGGESTRPGHQRVAAEEEWRRIGPVLEGLADGPAPPISVDTSRAGIARAALRLGAAIVNDVWGFQREPAIAEAAAEAGAAAVLMHNRERLDPGLDIIDDIRRVLARSVEIATRAGLGEDQIALDPGVGFGKTLEQNYAALAGLPRLREMGFPVLLGASRKSFIARLFDPQPGTAERLPGTLAAHVYGALAGADIIRVHDVAAHAQALRVVEAIRRAA